MSSTPKRRTKHDSRPKHESTKKTSDSSLSASLASLPSLMEPPQSIFPAKDDFSRLVAVVAIASVVAVCCNIFYSIFLNSQPKPFCDSDVDSVYGIDNYCEPCPSNGVCSEGKFECLDGYRKYGRSCMEDGVISEAAKKLFELVKSHLCEANAAVLCHGAGKVWFEEDDLWNGTDGNDHISKIASDNISTRVKQRAMEVIGTSFETKINSHGVKELKCPDLLAESFKPFPCRFHQWISQHAIFISLVFLLIVGFTFLLWKVHRRIHISGRAEELYDQVCELLEENSLMSKRGCSEINAWIISSVLRDHLLLPRERKDPVLWRKVEELIQLDSRIDRYPKLVKGEAKEVWEWQVEGSLSSSSGRRKHSDPRGNTSKPELKQSDTQANVFPKHRFSPISM